jgi:hypothetical protein
MRAGERRDCHAPWNLSAAHGLVGMFMLHCAKVRRFRETGYFVAAVREDSKLTLEVRSDSLTYPFARFRRLSGTV